MTKLRSIGDASLVATGRIQARGIVFMQDVFSGPEAMNTASPLLHALRELSDSLPPLEKREAENELIRKLINTWNASGPGNQP